MSKPVVVVGAGLAGLVCARHLHKAGHSVLVIDADRRVGGRLKTDIVDGFRLDRGFQVYFSAYPHAGEELDLKALRLGKFHAGALVWTGEKQVLVSKDDVMATLLSPFVPIGDKVRIGLLGQELRSMSDADIWAMEDEKFGTWLRHRGFSDLFIDRFLRPFFGGIFLDRSLAVSCRMGVYVWKMLETGSTCLPAEGMEAIPRQIAADLPEESFRLGERVDAIVKSPNGVTGVKLMSGEEIMADTVVIAADPVESARLTGLKIPREGKVSTTIWFDAPEGITDEPLLVLNGPKHGLINHVVDVSQAALNYAPKGHRLIGATILGMPDSPDDVRAAKSARYELQSWFPKLDVEKWRPLRVDRIPFAQMAQAPGFQKEMPANSTTTNGLFLAGEYTTYSSIDGAIKSGQEAAKAAQQHLERHAE